MNIVTCCALLCLKVETISADKRVVFGGCLVLALGGVLVCSLGDRKDRWGQHRVVRLDEGAGL